MSQRLIECLYEVPDRLTYFLCRRRPDHKNNQHFLVPEVSDCIEVPQLSKEAQAKLQSVSSDVIFNFLNLLNISCNWFIHFHMSDY